MQPALPELLQDGGASFHPKSESRRDGDRGSDK